MTHLEVNHEEMKAAGIRRMRISVHDNDGLLEVSVALFDYHPDRAAYSSGRVASNITQGINEHINKAIEQWNTSK